MKFIDTGKDWLNLIITLAIPLTWYLIVFKPWKPSIKNGNKMVSSFKKAGGKRGYTTKQQQDFDINYTIWGVLTSLSFFTIWLITEDY
ncbi:MAG: hypothetical protein NXH90_01900 [Flavobacteriaceae bacterium]|nr:hypothetical protein [Flavobacteriaceae bacterium]